MNVVRIAPFSAFEFFFYETYKHHLFAGDSTTNLSKLLCGGLTGMTASTLTYPLDLIRTKLAVIVDNPTAQGGKKPSIIGTGVNIYRRDGFFGLYRGLNATLFVSNLILFKCNSCPGHHTLRRIQNGLV